jgi:hypothetical protein
MDSSGAIGGYHRIGGAMGGEFERQKGSRVVGAW